MNLSTKNPQRKKQEMNSELNTTKDLGKKRNNALAEILQSPSPEITSTLKFIVNQKGKIAESTTRQGLLKVKISQCHALNGGR